MSQGTVIDFNEAREQKLDEKRRKTERIFFKQLLGVYCVIETQNGSKMMNLEPVDISEDGFSFQIPFDRRDAWPKEMNELTVRLYFTADTYIPVIMKAANSRAMIENGIKYTRVGCQVDQTVSSYSAYQQFVRFMSAYAVQAHQDKGDVTLFYL